MPDDHGRWGIEERTAYRPPPCESCGSTDIEVEWLPATDGDPIGLEFWTPAPRRCRSCGTLQTT